MIVEMIVGLVFLLIIAVLFFTLANLFKAIARGISGE
jgi:hypothetical protein